MSIPIKALVFDYGNVLSAPQQHSGIVAMASILELSEEEFVPHYWRHRKAYDAAELDVETYWRGVAADAGRDVSETIIQQLSRLDVESWGHPNPVMVQWARLLREAGIRTAVLSNMPTPLREYVTSTADWMPPFDHATYSCDVRSCKPDPSIYEHCLQGLGQRAEETLFLDDRHENVTAAQDLGMHSVVFTTARAARRTIESSYLLPVPLIL